MTTNATASRASVLTTYASAPVVAETTVAADLLHALQVVAQGAGKVLCREVHGLARLEVLTTIKEEFRDLELQRVLDDGHDALDLVVGDLTSALREVHLSLLAHHDGEAAAQTRDRSQSERKVAGAVHVRVENTQDVLKLLGLNLDFRLQVAQGNGGRGVVVSIQWLSRSRAGVGTVQRVQLWKKRVRSEARRERPRAWGQERLRADATYHRGEEPLLLGPAV